MSAPPPPKFIKDAQGVRRLNPAYKQWQAQNAGAGGAAAPAAPTASAAEQPNVHAMAYVPQMRNAATALPVISSIAEQKAHLGPDTRISASVEEANQRIHQAYQGQQQQAQSSADPMDQLQSVLGKYEVPLGLAKLLLDLNTYHVADCLVDDSGSMNSTTDVKDPRTNRWMTRWQEVHQRLYQMFELVSVVPGAPLFEIHFLNRRNVLYIQHQPNEPPQAFLQRAMAEINQCWQSRPSGTTPARERIAEQLARHRGKRCLRYFFGDGVPNGGEDAQEAITNMLVKRSSPQDNPFTFLSCTNQDEDVEWMKEAEEKAPFCAECDDFGDESTEVLRDQGAAMPYNFGWHLVAQLVGACNPETLDAMDECYPFTKQTLDSMLGYETAPQEYARYFQEFIKAQKTRKIEGKMDKMKRDQASTWEKLYQDFVRAPSSKNIPQVMEFRKKLADANSSCVIC